MSAVCDLVQNSQGHSFYWEYIVWVYVPRITIIIQTTVQGTKKERLRSLLFCWKIFLSFVWFLGLFLFLFWCCCCFQDRVSLCSPGCSGTHSIDQAGLELRDLPASASRVLGLKACATSSAPKHLFPSLSDTVLRGLFHKSSTRILCLYWL